MVIETQLQEDCSYTAELYSPRRPHALRRLKMTDFASVLLEQEVVVVVPIAVAADVDLWRFSGA